MLPSFLTASDDDFDRTLTERTTRTWVADVVVSLFVIGVAVAVHVDGSKAEPPTLLAIVDWLALPIGVVALYWRRQFPFAVCLLLAGMSVFSMTVSAAGIIAAYAVAAYGRPHQAYIGIGLLVATVPITSLIWTNAPGSPSSYWSDVIFGVIITLGIGAWGLFAGARRQLMASLRDRADRAEAEQQLRVEQARHGERTRIAREMHDVLAHRMSLLSVHAGALEFRPDAPPEEVARAAGVIRATAHEALEELRTVIGVLRVSDSLHTGGDGAAELEPAPPQPTLEAVPHLVEEWQQAGARINLDLDPQLAAQVPVTAGRTAYRIVQEALTNAGKHAVNSRVDVVVAGSPGESLTISVTNPLAVSGAGPTIPGTGVGLVGLRERTELAGGVFASGVDPDLRRFVVEARLPWSTTA